jgi:methyl-accepting chemotaxis protein
MPSIIKTNFSIHIHPEDEIFLFEKVFIEMKLSGFFLMSYAAIAVAGGALALLPGESAALMITGCVAVGAFVLGLTGFTTMQMKQGLRHLEHTIASGQSTGEMPLGLKEFNETAERLSEHVHRWNNIAVHGREQSRQIDKLLTQLNRLSGKGKSASSNSTSQELRGLLGGLSRRTGSDLREILTFNNEIEQSTNAIATGAEDQSDAVSKTTTYVEQMSVNIDIVSQNAGSAHTATLAAQSSAVEALEFVQDLIRGMDHIRLQVQGGERRLRALGDRSHEIGSIVETIGTISSRTDLLALNASIESVRAGEHGRGFAIVADEVRSLAEQTAQATREVAGLIQSVQFETQEAIDMMAEEHSQIEAEVKRVKSAGDALEQISRTTSDSATRVGEISQTAQRQLHLTQEVVIAMERISDVARTSRNHAEGMKWTTKSLTKMARQLENSLSPLKGCLDGQQDQPRPSTSDDEAQTDNRKLDDSSWNDGSKMSSTQADAVTNITETYEEIMGQE